MPEDDLPETVWFALQHSRGPTVPAGTAVADDPGIAEHYAFLRRRLAAGQLVAAGPLADEPGAGLTVLAVDTLDEAERLATRDDQSVVAGVLTVRVRPWRVVLRGSAR
ncbi:YciI family protein [Cellulomonas composti]|nr:YciI family protein [Cellulomonas composti]